MNRKQKACLLVGIAAIVLMGLFPPWVIQRNIHNPKFIPVLMPGPYSWIDSPPTEADVYRTKFDKYYGKREVLVSSGITARFIDLYRLGLQYFVVAVVTAGLIIILGNRKRSK